MRLDPFGTLGLGMMIISAFVMALVLYAVYVNVIATGATP
jgi:hypothetical protein